MRHAVAVMMALALGCDDAPVAAPDASVEPDAGAPDGDFYGEPCSPPSAVGFVSLCRLELPYPKAYCTPEGICRPFCDQCKAIGGVETYAFPMSAARVCYCAPPE